MARARPTTPARRLATILLAVAFALGPIACGRASEPPSAPVLGTLPDFALVDQEGSGFGSDELRGTVWIADFIFTRCPDMCPMLSSVMARVQRQLARDPAFADVRLVSISVDPEHDTPERLAAYAAKYGAEPDRWFFLTGERQAIWRLSKEGFRLAVGESPRGADAPLFHSDKFVLADRAGRIRGYYDATDQEALLALMRDLRGVAAEAVGAAPLAPGA
jgi:protein SCO1/2